MEALTPEQQAKAAEIEQHVQAQGELIRKMKQSGIVDKAKLEPHVERLKTLKQEYKDLTGTELGGKAKGKSEGGAKPQEEKKTTNPKKEAARLAKLAKFEAKQKGKATEAAAPKANDEKKKEKKEKTVTEFVFKNETPKGDKKDTTQPLPDAYHPKYVEAAWYDWWEKERMFKPEGKNDQVVDNPKGTFMMVIPPPNVTGSLHLGHALTNAIEDTLARWNRMKGKTVLWSPGTDHAGIATQVVVEKKMWKDQKVTRHQIGREAFLSEVWKWKDEYGHRIEDQLRSLGASVDWDRSCFTMDPKMGKAVSAAFVKFHEKGMLYRSTRLVNWCTQLKSAISDLEVEHVELQGSTMRTVVGHGTTEYEFGTMTSFAYPIDGLEEEIVVATTRIETMLGDTAVAVHPDDARYQHLHGRHVVHPFTKRRIPIVTDTYVEIGFGTGAVKITPGHDFNDYELGLRHNLPIVSIFNDDGTVNGCCPQFQGLLRFDARNAVLAALKEMNLYRGSTSNPMTLPICSRTKDIVEPMIKPQWFLDCTKPAADAVNAVRSGELKLIPSSNEKTWYRWLENIKPWCVSRQLWWGHRIPAYLVEIVGGEALDPIDQTNWVVATTEEEALSKAAKQFGVSEDKIKLHQDPDVLDTWFSSGLFPFSVLGWPDKTDDLKRFYPGHLLETGHDILFFWVARMVMMGLSLMDELPFKEVYLHALVRDAHGRKMSKSLGNVVDPIDVIHGITLEDLNNALRGGNLDPREVEKAIKGQKEDYPNGIPECGTDALRFALLAYAMAGKDVNLDVNRIVGYRYFCNKLWNASKFALMRLGADFKPLPVEQKATDKYSLVDRWILSRLSSAVAAVNSSLTSYSFPNATQAIYNFWLYEFCDVYLESIKPVFNATGAGSEEAKQIAQEVLFTCLDTGLRMLHPIMPFITEELWQRLPRRDNNAPSSIMIAAFPEEAIHMDVELEGEHTLAYDIIKAIRSVKSRYLQPKDRPEAIINCKSEETLQIANKYLAMISTLATTGPCRAVLNEKFGVELGAAISQVGDRCEIYVVVKGLVDVNKELAKIVKRQGEAKAALEKLAQSIATPGYEEKVPGAVRVQNSEK
eukprot:Ihof_evm16s20 gene=Ihof_evmTU16s20